MAPNTRYVNALNAMKEVGFPEGITEPVLKDLLKVYRYWEPIEAENYRLLADMILEFQENKGKEAAKRKDTPLSDNDDPQSKRINLTQASRVLPAGCSNSPSSSTTAAIKEGCVKKHLNYDGPMHKISYGGDAISQKKHFPSTANADAGDAFSQRKHFPNTANADAGDAFSQRKHFPNTANADGSDAISQKKHFPSSANADGSDAISQKKHFPSSGTSIEISPSSSSEVKISLGYRSSFGRSVLHAPSLDAIIKLAEERFLKYQKVDNPDFPLVEMMEKLCQYLLKEVIHPTDNKNLIRTKTSLKKSGSLAVVGSASGDKLRTHRTGSSSNKPQDVLNGHHSIRPEKKILEPSTSRSSKYDDISNGREKFPIPVVMQVNRERLPPAFHYISQNLISQNAYVNCSLARIGDENCCSECVGDCVTSPIPCACARETGGVFAYTADGILKSEFLDQCILKGTNAPTSHLYYCEDCPLERSSKSGLNKCKGHFLGKFIKECWMKCGCSTQCGNRVVQRGITRKLQVFFTPEGKGWGLRTVDALPRGAFVCEYIGEILTNTELYNRNKESTGDEEHTYPLLLDADWASEGRLEDDHALCLDATYFGNVARFINHRCSDPTLVEIPVEIETPDHHYYHVAFFTSRDVAAFEELTWDYGIDFLDVNHPVKAFRCRCGSSRCRDVSIAKC